MHDADETGVTAPGSRRALLGVSRSVATLGVATALAAVVASPADARSAAVLVLSAEGLH